jgi:hypothetical protein
MPSGRATLWRRPYSGNFPQHLDRCVDGRPRSVLDGARHPEERHHAVAHVLVDEGAVAAGDLVHELQTLSDDAVGLLVAPLDQGGEAGQVGEENRRPAPLGLSAAL